MGKGGGADLCRAPRFPRGADSGGGEDGDLEKKQPVEFSCAEGAGFHTGSAPFSLSFFGEEGLYCTEVFFNNILLGENSIYVKSKGRFS